MKGLGSIFARWKEHVKSGDLIYNNSMHVITVHRGSGEQIFNQCQDQPVVH